MRKFTSTFLAVSLCVAAFAQEKVDLAAVEKIRQHGLDQSKVMDIAYTITDVYGPRLSNSPGLIKAQDWAVKQLSDWQRLEDDIYLSIPYMERKAFEKDLNRASESRDAIEVVHNFWCPDGRVVKMKGFMKAQRGEEPGDIIFKLTYQPVEVANPVEKPGYHGSFINALKNAYDVVLYLDTKNHYCEFVKCSTFRNQEMYRGVKVLLNNSFSNLLDNVISSEDREGLRSLVDRAMNEGAFPGDEPAECEFRFLNGENIEHYYCTYVKFSMREIYLCCRLLPEDAASETTVPSDGEHAAEQREIRVRMFGYFDVFIDGKAIPFKNKKAKELLALLVARNGGFVSPDEIVGCLWENESVNKSTLARIRKTYFSLVQELREYGIGELVESKGSMRRAVSEMIQSCDLYSYVNGEHSPGRPENFLRNYSWGEYIADDILGESEEMM